MALPNELVLPVQETADDFDWGDRKVSDKFELFSAYVLFKSHFEMENEKIIDSIDNGEIDQDGIDGFIIMIQNEVFLANEHEEINQYLQENTGRKKRIVSKCELIFLCCTTSEQFDNKKYNKFLADITILMSNEDKQIGKCLSAIERYYAYIKDIELRVFYTYCGRKEQLNTINYDKLFVEKVENKNIFKDHSIEIYDKTMLNNSLKKLNNQIEKDLTINGLMATSVGEREQSVAAYLGFIDSKTLLDLITYEENKLEHNIFYENIRDYLGKTPINDAIENSISDPILSRQFLLYNNGITLIADEVKPHGNTYYLLNPQIINGCQTASVLFENRKSQYFHNINLPIKIIETNDIDLKTNITKATNNQNTVNPNDLVALKDFTKKLEDFFENHQQYLEIESRDRIYFERRRKQHKGKKQINIINVNEVTKAIISMYYKEPNVVRYLGTKVKEYKLFDDSHEVLPYFAASYLLNKITRFIMSKEPKCYSYRYHVLYAFAFKKLQIKEGDECLKGKVSKKTIEPKLNEIIDNIKNNSQLFNSEIENILKTVKNIQETYYPDVKPKDLVKKQDFLKKLSDNII